MTEVVCAYYKLKEQKNMNDSHFISADQNLLKLKEGMYMTSDSSSVIRVFYAKEEEVVFIENKIEEWDDEKIKFREKILNDSWLTEE